MTNAAAPRLLDFIGAFATGGLLTLMVWFNGTLAATGSLLFASWVPHATGAILAIIVVLVLRPTKSQPTAKVPWWAYLGGVSGAITVMVTSATMQTAPARHAGPIPHHGRVGYSHLLWGRIDAWFCCARRFGRCLGLAQPPAQWQPVDVHLSDWHSSPQSVLSLAAYSSATRGARHGGPMWVARLASSLSLPQAGLSSK